MHRLSQECDQPIYLSFVKYRLFIYTTFRNSSHSSQSSNSSESDVEDTEENVWRINEEQKAYYLNQFRVLQPAEKGVVAGESYSFFQL